MRSPTPSGAVIIANILGHTPSEIAYIAHKVEIRAEPLLGFLSHGRIGCLDHPSSTNLPMRLPISAFPLWLNSPQCG